MNLQLAVTVLLLALGLLAVNARPRGQRVSSEVVGPIAVMFGGRGAYASLVYLEQVIARRVPPPIAADLRPCADGSAVRTALAACRAGVAPRPAVGRLGYLGQTDGRTDKQTDRSIA